MATCKPCNRRFGDEVSLNQHLLASSQHIHCRRCQKAFPFLEALRQHLGASKRHNICTKCSPSKDFTTANGLANHILDAHQHQRTQTRRGPLNYCSRIGDGYTGISKSSIRPIFNAACRLKHSRPKVADIIELTGTALEPDIVSAITQAALRLPPMDNSPQGIKARRKRDAKITEQALGAEADFLEHFTVRGYRYLSERQQKELNKANQGLKSGFVQRSTPDILFVEPTVICGHPCHWIEYKNFFGFRSNPFVAARNRKQFQRYATAIGPGAVVYKLGYERDHINIKDVQCFRETEVLQELKTQNRGH